MEEELMALDAKYGKFIIEQAVVKEIVSEEEPT
jgi:hypothetical protein